MNLAVKLDGTPGAPAPVRGTGNVSLSLGDFKRIADIMKLEAGISMSDDKVNLVHARLQKRLRALSLDSFRPYIALVEGQSAEGRAERKVLLNALTTNLTRFYREPHHFQHLAKVALPPLVKKAKNGGRVRIWSAGCSTGEEPYSIASILHLLCPEAARLNIKILASDIDSNVLRTGHTGVYNEMSVKNLPNKVKSRYFMQDETNPSDYHVSQDLKSLISFKQLNLNAPRWPMYGKFDILFCRNTVIYFDAPTQIDIWTKFQNQMQPEGFLYIGHSERVSGPAEDVFEKAGVTIYQLPS